MNTPITDAVRSADHLIDTARRLELDRSALMEVCSRLAELDLNGTDDSLVRFIVQAHQNSANTALAAAHTNFPTP
jgi:hypothetical protein